MNGEDGFFIHHSSASGCVAYDNGFFGFDCDYSTVTNCSAHNNSRHGIRVVTESRVVGNDVRGNGHESENGYGIYLLGDISSHGDSYVIKNTASDNYSGNFFDDGTNNYMPMTGDNANYGF